MSEERARRPVVTPPPFRRRLAWPVAAVLLTLGPGGAEATSITWGDEINKSVAWPKSSTINVFIQKDPKNQGRDALLKEGVERWKQKLADRMITLNVSIGDPPDGTDNPVRYTWEADGVKSEGGEHELGEGKDAAFSGPTLTRDTDSAGRPVKGSERYTEGSAKVRNALPASTADEKNFLRNLGEHEMTHILGLKDDPQGSVTKHEQKSDDRPFNDRDKEELNSLYGTAGTGGAGKPHGLITPSGGGPAFGFFRFDVDFVAANPVADPDDPEHVPLIIFSIDPDLVTAMQVPPGWVTLIPHGPVAAEDAYFIDDVVFGSDGVIAPSPFSSIPRFVATQISLVQGLDDGLGPDPDAALSLRHLHFAVTIFTVPDVVLGPIEVWAGGDLQVVAGPVSRAGAPGGAAFATVGLALLVGRRAWAAARQQGVRAAVIFWSRRIGHVPFTVR